MALYLVANGPMPTTAAQAVITTGTVIKTLIQLKPFNTLKIVEWGISFDGAADAAKIKCELLDTGTVFATGLTAYADVDITKLGSVEDAVASIAGLTLGTAASGFQVAGQAEGTITAVRMFDPQLVSPAGGYVKQFPLGREPKGIIGNAIRIRVTAAAAVNAYCYAIIEI